MNLFEEFNSVKNYFSPKIIGEANNQYVKIAKVKGNDIPWHNHINEDELFYVIEGRLLIQIENNESWTLTKGDIRIVPKGVFHKISSVEECLIMIIEPKTTKHTGEVITDVTKSIRQQFY